MIKDEEIARLLDQGDDDIYASMAEKLGIEVLGISPEQKRNRLISLAKDWYSKNKESLKQQICASDSLKLILSHNTPSAIVRVIADIIFHHFVGVPPVEISVIILREGVNRICHDHQ